MSLRPGFPACPLAEIAMVLGLLSGSQPGLAQPAMLTPLPTVTALPGSHPEPGSLDGGLAAADLDGDGRLEIVVGVGEPWGGRLVTHRASAALAASALSPRVEPPLEPPSGASGEHIHLAPHFMACGDLDGDRRVDLLVGERGADEVLFLAGGRATGLAPPRRASLPGRLSSLTSATVSGGCAVIMAWQSSGSTTLAAIRSLGEISRPQLGVALPGAAVDLAVRPLPSGDLVVAALTAEAVVELRLRVVDRGLEMVGSTVEHRLVQPARAVAIGTSGNLVVLAEDGVLYALAPHARGATLAAMFRAWQGPLPASARLVTAGVSGRSADDLLVTVPESGTTIWSEDGRELGSLPAGRVLAARLNHDHVDDLVLLREGSPEPRVYASVPSRVFAVDSARDDSDAALGDAICADPWGSCTLRAAIEEANASPGLDAALVQLPEGGPHRILLRRPLPEIEEAMTLDLSADLELEPVDAEAWGMPLLRSRSGVRTTLPGVRLGPSPAWPAIGRPLGSTEEGRPPREAGSAPDSGDWQWLNPRPQGEKLNAVWGAGVGQVWAVGDRGAATRRVDGVWERVPSTIDNDLRTLSGTSLNDVFVGAGSYQLGGDTFHWDGVGWTDLPDDAIWREVSGIWAAATNDVWAVTESGSSGGGETWHWDGSSWTYVATPASVRLFGVWGAASNDVFAVGQTGTVYHWNGVSWGAMSSGTTALLEGVWGSHGGNVYAVGSGGAIVHYDGIWNAQTSPTTADLHAVWVGDGVAYAVGDNGVALRSSGGGGWEAMSTPGNHDLYGVWAALANDAYAVGENGVILHYDGNLDLEWTMETRGTLSTLDDLCDDGRQVIAVGDGGTIATFTGFGWEVEDGWLTPSDVDLRAISADTQGNMWVVGAAGAVWYGQRNRWTKVDPGTSQTLSGVWGRGGSAWVVGNGGTILSVDTAGNVAPMDSGTTANLSGIWGWSTDAYAVGWSVVLRFENGVGWVDTGFPSSGVTGVWGTGPTNVYVAAGPIYHYDGGAWTLETSGTYRAIWGRGPSDIYAVGANGTAAHFDGSGWTSETVPTTVTLNAVAAGGSGGVFAVGPDMSIFQRSPGGTWSQEEARAFPYDLRGLALSGGAAAELYAVGEGVIMLRDGSEWKAAASAAPSAGYGGDLEAVSCAPGQSEVWATGRPGYYRHNGLSWERQDRSGASAGGNAVFAAAPDAVFVGGNSGTISLWDGTQWQDMDTAGTTWDVYDLWGSSAADVWAVGRFGTILHYGGGPGLVWEVHASGTTADLYGVRGTPIGILAVGASATALLYTGQWTPIDIGAFAGADTLMEVGANGTDTYVVGSSQSERFLFHHTALGWEVLDLPSAGPFRAISLNQWDHLFVAGDSGKILGASPSGAFYGIFADGFESGDTSAW